MSIDAKQKDLVHKLLGMLGSDFDGERAVAAKKISDIAKANKLSIQRRQERALERLRR